MTESKESLQLFVVTYLEWLELFAVACNVPEKSEIA